MNIKFPFILNLNKKIKNFHLQEKILKFPIFLTFSFLGFVPLIFAVCYHLHFFYRMEANKCRAQDISRRLQQAAVIKQKKQDFYSRFRDADPYYLDKTVEPLVFLNGEIRFLETALKYKAFEYCDAMKDRLAFLKEQNRLRFCEKDRFSGSLYQEVHEKQIHPVEIDLEDLKVILTYIEGAKFQNFPENPSGRPLLFIKDFELIKQKKTDSPEIFHLQMEVIKREVK